MVRRTEESAFWKVARPVLAGLAAIGLTLLFFLILPILQTISDRDRADMEVREFDVANIPPPPPPPPEPEPEEQEEEPPPPDIQPQAAPLDLAQLELALNPNLGGAGMGDFGVNIVNELASEGASDSLDQVFSLADLDQKPRLIFQRPPRYPPDLRRKGRGGTVTMVFTVDESGRVQNPKVEKSTDPAFDKPALDAVRQWRFEPGSRGGQKVSFKMRIPITFNP